MVRELLIDHPASVGEIYGQHLAHALAFGLRMILGGIADIGPGPLHFLFVKTGSLQIKSLQKANVIGPNNLPGPTDLMN